MLAPRHCPEPVNRREFLRLGLLSLGGLTTARRLVARSESVFPRKETTVILFWMWGGPSHLETYDLKPEAPTEYRGPFRPIRTTVPGLDICELFPLQAQRARRFSLIRSLHHTMSSHNDGSIEVLTGKTPVRPDPTSTAFSEHPDFGMVASRMRGSSAHNLPPYVGIPSAPFMTRPNYLGLGHKGFNAGDPSLSAYVPPKLGLAGGIGESRFRERRTLLGRFDVLRRELDWQGRMQGADEVRGRALDLLTTPQVAAAFDLAKEDPRLRDRYGRHLWGQSCLLARRLAEAGVAVISVDASTPIPGNPLYFSWDDHANAQPGWDMAKGMRWRAQYLDQAIATLIDDLYDRGLDRQVLLVAMGEFGRSPRVSTANGCVGRDHWPDAMCALISGGGLRMGQVVGSTNSRGEYPKEHPLTPKDLLATMYRHLGIDHRHEFRDLSGRPVGILPEGEPIAELI
jgi:hypothetical protein